MSTYAPGGTSCFSSNTPSPAGSGCTCRKVLKTAIDDEQVQQPLVNRGKRRHRPAVLGVAQRQSQLRRTGAASARRHRYIHPVLAEAWRRDGHEIHAAERAVPRRSRPHVEVHRAPEGVRRVEVANDLDNGNLRDAKERGIIGHAYRLRAVRAQDRDYGGGIGGRERDMVEHLGSKRGREAGAGARGFLRDLHAMRAQPTAGGRVRCFG